MGELKDNNNHCNYLERLIREIGYIGYHNINSFSIKDYQGNEIITFNSKKGQAYNYNIDDHCLNINFPDGKKITFTTKSVDKEGNDNPYITEIDISYEDQQKNAIFKTYINGWGYDKLLYYSLVNLVDNMIAIKKDKNGELLFKQEWDYNVTIEENGPKMSIADIIHQYVYEEVKKNETREQIMDYLLSKLTEEEKQVLRLKLGTRK